MEPTLTTNQSEATQSVATTPQATVAACLDQASQLQSTGKVGDAAAELEKALATARATPYEIEFQTRVRLGMMLSDVYLSLGQTEKAREILAGEVEFTHRVSGIMQATGTPSQKRAATSGYLQIRDRATQIGLIGTPAPEISIRTWINGEAVRLEDLLGRVVLLEFWATWCKPCQEMFPKLKQLHEDMSPRGLAVVAVTRHYMAYGGTPEAQQEELLLMKATVNQHAVTFPVGVADDESLQTTYGANGLPTAIIIDRRGLVRYAGPGGEDRGFDATLRQNLDESA